MSASTHRPSPRSTLPAFPLQRRSRSPPDVPAHSSSHLRRSLSPKGVRLPPIQSLDFAPRPAPRERIPSQPLGTPLQDHYPHSSDPQFSSRNLKRAAASVGSDVSQGPYKKRRTEDLNEISQNTSSHVPASAGPGPESHAHNLAKKGHKSLTPMDHPPLNNQHSTPPNPADSRPGLLSRASSSSTRTPSHSREPSWHQPGPPQPPQQPQVPPKLEQTSPPASLGPASAASNTPWSSDAPPSFSRRLSQSTSGQRPTSRKQPPSRLTLQPHGSQQPAARSLQPAIQSAPPIPVHGGPPNMMRSQGQWMPERRNNAHPSGGGGHPSVAGVSNASVSTTTSILNAEAIPAPAIRSTARHGTAAYPALPTPTSLRLGALQQQQQQQLHPPLQTAANPNAGFPNSPSPYGYRGPVTPAVPSPLPVLGSGTGVSDKAKFMSKMSEIYDRATSHRNCVSIEEVDRRIKDATNGLQQEIVALRKEVDALRKGTVQKERSVEIGDGDGDVNMEPLPPPAAGEGPSASKAPILPELPKIEPPTPQSEQPSVSEAPTATMNGRVTAGEKGKEKERDSPKDMTPDKETPPK